VQDIGDVHLATTFDTDAASIRFHTRQAQGSKGTANERYTIGGNGKVGIGEPTPTVTLELAEGRNGDVEEDVILRLHPVGTSNDPIIQMVGSGGNIAQEGFEVWYDNSVGDAHFATTYENNAASIRFHTKTSSSKSTGNERFTIAANGNIGVNKPQPEHTLDVDGNIRATGYIEAHNTDNAWLALHLAAAAACRAVGNAGGCCGNTVHVRNVNSQKTCNQICGASVYNACDGEVSIGGSSGKATENGQIVGSFYNYGCNSFPNGGSEVDASNTQSLRNSQGAVPGYFGFCCCRKA